MVNQTEIKLEAIKDVLQTIREMRRKATNGQYMANENPGGLYKSSEEAKMVYEYSQQVFIYWGKLQEVALQELELLKRDN